MFMMEGIKFPEIRTEYDYFTIGIEGRKIKLTYRIRQYVLVKKLKKAKHFQKKGIKLKTYGIKRGDGKVATAYYRPYTIKLTSLKTKRRMIALILGILVGDKEMTLEEHIKGTWSNKNFYKTAKDKIVDKEARILDILSSYYLGGLEEEKIFTRDRQKAIEQKEIITLDGMTSPWYEGNHKEGEGRKYNWEIANMKKEKHRKYLAQTPKRWKSSNTYKINNLFSFNNHKNEGSWYDWIRGQWRNLDSNYHYKIDRLIDGERPYKAEWCLVDTENVFKFNGEKLMIDKSVKQYRVGRDNSSEMEKILVLEQDGERYYFDEKINYIQNKKIIITT